ncbi:DUF192 domain-containing protein [Paramagnetospirillum kuznetsovii]|nr:DUF192 domain-containing protein [Paramagnetospirillum kuznetsovii]
MSAALADGVTFGWTKLEVITSDAKHHMFKVELAETQDQLSQGLMFRKTLAADTGMLFNFARARPVSMWMKNTLIPLDMLFIDRAGLVIHVEEFAVPGTLEPRGPSQPVLGVLELPAGTSRRLGIRPGDRVDHAIFTPRP